MLSYAVLAILVLSILGFVMARQRAIAFVDAADAGADTGPVHSLPGYHGMFIALWVGIPSLILVVLWLLLQNSVINGLLLSSLPDGMTQELDESGRSLLISQIRSLASGQVFGEPSPEVLAAAERLKTWQGIAAWAMLASGIAVALAGLALGWRRLAPAFRARHGVERILNAIMIVSSLIAIVTTLGIILSLVFEAWQFFELVPIGEFFFGLNWEPQMPIRADQVAGLGAFGAVPVFLGTLVISVIAMLVATPIGLFSAIYLAEYANPKIRSMVKPILEILAGIPTIVYGFFAILTVAPALRSLAETVGLQMAPTSALVAGGVMGIMIIPFISSLSDDALRAVPRTLREGSYGLGATKAETIVNVLLPAALPGIVGGVLLAASRAIGETMIVVMAAGLLARMTINPLDSVTTVTVQIVTLLIGDTEFDSPKTLAAFALGLVLFIITLGLNIIALRTVKKYREKYD